MEVMRVEFTKHEKNGRVACAWTATRGKRTEVPGSLMPAGKDIPHDLGQYVVEAATGYADGFWGLIDRGATFKSTGRKATRPGRAIIRDHRAELDASEGLAGAHLAAWRAGRHLPAPFRTFAGAARQKRHCIRAQCLRSSKVEPGPCNGQGDSGILVLSISGIGGTAYRTWGAFHGWV